MRPRSTDKLVRMVKDLQERRRAVVKELAKIDGAFARAGIPVTPAKTVLVPMQKVKRSRRRFKVPIEQFVLAKLAGGKILHSSVINKAAQDELGASTADTALSRLTGERKIIRTPSESGRGSDYRLAA